MPEGSSSPTDEDLQQFVEALETLPLLTRTVFLLACRDSFPYAEIGWRCGISIDEVRVHIIDALNGLGRHTRAGPSLAGRIRRAVLPWRDTWAASRARECDRRLAPWLSPEKRPAGRGALDWIAWGFERIAR